MNVRKRVWLFPLVGLIIAVLFLWIGSLILSNVIETKVRDFGKLGAYDVDFESVDVNLFTRSIVMQGIVLKDSLQNVQLQAPAIKVKQFRIFPALFKRKFQISKVLVSNPKLFYQLREDKSEKPKHTRAHDDKIPQIDIKTFEVENAESLFYRMDSLTRDTVFRAQINFKLNNISSHDTSLQYNANWAFFDGAALDLSKIRYVLPGGLYRLETDKFRYDSEENKAQLDSFSLKSEFTKYEIAHHTGVQTDWYDIIAKSVTLENLNLTAALQDTAFVVSGVYFHDVAMTVFRDKRLPFPEKPDTKLPPEMIDNLPFGLHIDSVLLENTNIRYEEHWENNDQPGAVTFDNLQGRIKNISNCPDLINGETKIEVSCNVLEDALFNVEFKFPNKKHPVAYRTEGRLGAMPMKPFNSLFRSSASADITSGTIHELKFAFTYDNESSSGVMNFEYDDLKVSLFDPEGGDTKKVKTFLLNTFIVNDQNPDKNRNLKQGKIAFERDKNKSIFNYWWKSVMSGIKDVVAGS